MRYLLTLLPLAPVLSPAECKPQFYKVHGYETLEHGEIEGVVWNSYVAQADGSFSFFGEPVDRDGLWAHSLEAEYGVMDRHTLTARTDFLGMQREPFRHVRSRAVFLRYRFGAPGRFFFAPAIFLEYHLPRSSYEEPEKLEVRVILEQSPGDMVLHLNPIFEKATSGSEVEEGLEFTYAAGIYYSHYHALQPALEVYGELGELTRPEPLEHQGLVVFPTLDLRVAALHWHVGVGFRLTGASDEVTIKSILPLGSK